MKQESRHATAKPARVVVFLCVLTAIALPAQTFTTLVNFNGTNGSGPYYGSLTQGIDGRFYGETVAGGAHNFGTVFRFDPDGTLTTLYSFDETDGNSPTGGLVQATNGDFYGTTAAGGPKGHGTVFKITSGGVLKTLHSFDWTDGRHPYSGLIQAANGELYGTTFLGGAHDLGTIFKITPGGVFTLLYSFDGTNSGSQPLAAPIQAADEKFYGTTCWGGGSGYGTVYQFTPQGPLTTVYGFGAGGENPCGGLVQDNGGSLFGTTIYEAAHPAFGTIFKITQAGALTTLHVFGSADGALPYAALTQATDGNFYGTTEAGGTGGGWGTIFKMTPSGALITLLNFNSTDGNNPFGGLLQGTDGDLYGTTYGGGHIGYGTVFRLSLGLSPFVKTLPTSGKVGQNILILGTNLRGATSVSFNGTAAAFTVVSKTVISATLPAGATTGFVKVTGPGGTLKSNLKFQVLP